MLRCVSWEAVSSKRQAGGDKVSLERQREVNCQAIEKIGGVHAVSLVVPGQSRSIILFEDACRKVGRDWLLSADEAERHPPRPGAGRPPKAE